MRAITPAAAIALFMTTMILFLALALFTWIGFGGISEADKGLSPSPVRVGLVFAFLGLGLLCFIAALMSVFRALWSPNKRTGRQ